MDLFAISTIGGFSIGIAASTGLVRYHHIVESYRPFIFICCLAFVNEITSYITAHVFHNNAVNLNIYILAEAILYLWLFSNWRGFRSRFAYGYTLIFLTGVWIVDNFILNSFLTINSLFRVVYSFTLIFLSINQLNKLLLIRREQLIRDPRFLICSGIMIYYSYKATIETFYLLQINFSNHFYNQVHFVLEIVNVFVNLVFALAITWIPRKQKFILPF
jgi:hypothetical protein